MASWQSTLTSVLLRHLFKPHLARARDVAAARKAMAGRGSAPLPRTRAVQAHVGGIAGEWIIADEVPTTATLIYLHGGGYIACSPQTHRAVTCAFALAGFRTFAPDYRLAPENPFPAGLEDAVNVYRALLQEHDPRQIVIAGDSAGGGLSVALLLSLREQHVPLPVAAALFSPFVDLAITGESIQRNSMRCAMFSSEVFARAADFYVGDRDKRSPLASPLYADLRGLPPLLIHVGEDETLLDDSLRLAARAREAGVEVELKTWPVVPHVWQLFHRWIPEGRASLRDAAKFFVAHVRSAAEKTANQSGATAAVP
jgi:acetyl esterase/lipase